MVDLQNEECYRCHALSAVPIGVGWYECSGCHHRFYIQEAHQHEVDARHRPSHRGGAARDYAAARAIQRQARDRMRSGPFLRAGEIRIPSYAFFVISTPVANAEWKKRGLGFDGATKEWHIAVPKEKAEEQLARCRELFYQFFRFDHAPAGSREDRADTERRRG